MAMHFHFWGLSASISSQWQRFSISVGTDLDPAVRRNDPETTRHDLPRTGNAPVLPDIPGSCACRAGHRAELWRADSPGLRTDPSGGAVGARQYYLTVIADTGGSS